MKKSKILKTLRKSIMALFVLSYQAIISQHACINFDDLREDKINLAGYIKEYSKVRPQKSNFSNYTRYDDGSGEKVLNADPIIINMRALVQLFDLLPSESCRDIRGVKVAFGLRGDKVLLYFRPIVMKPMATNTALPIAYTPDPINPVTYKYRQSDSSFVSIDASDLTAISNYTLQMRIKRRWTSIGFSELNQDSDTDVWQRDTKEVIFSYQEILSLYHSIYKCTTGTNPANDYNKDLYFYNGVAPYFLDNTDWPRRRKHTLFIALEDINSLTSDNLLMVADINKAANLAHLCPPSCVPYYNIVRIASCD